MCDTAKLIFARVAEVTSVDIEMPNIHYFMADLRKLNIPISGEVCVCVCVCVCVTSDAHTTCLFSREFLARLQELSLHGSQCLLSAQASWLCQVRVTT